MRFFAWRNRYPSPDGSGDDSLCVGGKRLRSLNLHAAYTVSSTAMHPAYSAIIICLVTFSGRAADVVVDLSKLPPPAQRRVDFIKDIQPLFAKNCYACH